VQWNATLRRKRRTAVRGLGDDIGDVIDVLETKTRDSRKCQKALWGLMKSL
jgi:hypothetical protein